MKKKIEERPMTSKDIRHQHMTLKRGNRGKVTNGSLREV
jgi:hypothetical protein